MISFPVLGSQSMVLSKLKLRLFLPKYLLTSWQKIPKTFSQDLTLPKTNRFPISISKLPGGPHFQGLCHVSFQGGVTYVTCYICSPFTPFETNLKNRWGPIWGEFHRCQLPPGLRDGCPHVFRLVLHTKVQCDWLQDWWCSKHLKGATQLLRKPLVFKRQEGWPPKKETKKKYSKHPFFRCKLAVSFRECKKRIWKLWFGRLFFLFQMSVFSASMLIFRGVSWESKGHPSNATCLWLRPQQGPLLRS